ncbi:hypothetical protein ON010_g4412 [Phytophthora cinnamomi]|nr:hypothetical protein ON010_g4412 [Phytophthora cinnamomi]
MSVTADQFSIVPAFACATKTTLQGQTCQDGVVVTPLNRRDGVPKQAFYVALSMAKSLAGLKQKQYEKLSREFQPNEATVNEMLRLIGMVTKIFDGSLSRRILSPLIHLIHCLGTNAHSSTVPVRVRPKRKLLSHFRSEDVSKRALTGFCRNRHARKLNHLHGDAAQDIGTLRSQRAYPLGGHGMHMRFCASTSSSTAMTTPEVREADDALEKMFSSGQKRTVTERAHNSVKTVDYVTLPNSCHYVTVRGHPRVLATTETSTIAEMKAVLDGCRALDAKARSYRSPVWKEESVRVHVAHQHQYEEMDQSVETLLVTARSEQGVAALMDRLREQNMMLRRKETDLRAFAASLNGKQVALQDQGRLHEEERHRINGRLALNERLEQRYRTSLATGQEDKKAWKRDRAAIQKKTFRLISMLKSRKRSTSTPPAIEE